MRLISSFCQADTLDANGMHKDVHVADIDNSDTEEKKQNRAADIDHFFDRPRRGKGELNAARAKCLSCRYVTVLIISYLHNDDDPF